MTSKQNSDGSEAIQGRGEKENTVEADWRFDVKARDYVFKNSSLPRRSH